MRLSVWVGLTFLLGCVNGGDDSTGKPQGSLGGPCYANNTCDSPLSCVLESGKGICEAGDATVTDAPNDQSSADTGSDAGTSDAGDACSQTLAPLEPCKPCTDGGMCCSNMGTCFASATCASTCTGGASDCWKCETASDCTVAGDFCCLPNAVVQPSCPPAVAINTTPSCATTCVGAFLCLKPADCPSSAPTCVGATASGINGGVLGVCQ